MIGLTHEIKQSGQYRHPANRRITMAAFWPPKSKLVEMAVRNGTSRAQFGTKSRSQPRSGVVWLNVGGSTPSCTVSARLTRVVLARLDDVPRDVVACAIAIE
jgi:hypothetical protein